jgi:hypothetical protein
MQRLFVRFPTDPCTCFGDVQRFVESAPERELFVGTTSSPGHFPQHASIQSKEDVMGYEGRDPRWSRGQDYGYRDRDSASGYRNQPRGYDYEDRGFFERAGDEVRSWFGDDEAERRRRWDEREYERRHPQDRAYGYDRGDDARGGYGTGGHTGGAYFGSYASGPSDYAPYKGGTYRENSGGRYDPRYHEWRSRQIDELDRDYDDYRREHQSRFEQDFGSWRNTRQGQRSALGNVREHQEVVGSDGTHVGTVDHVRGDRIILTKGDENAGGRHHSIPCGWVNTVSDKVELNRTAADAQQAWKDEERRSAIGGRDYDDPNGPHVLNRSFSGTY